MFELENNKLKIAVKNIGAELCDISSTQNKTQFMWDANPNIWDNYAPNLFPVIGALKDDTYLFENKEYNLPKHGFIRQNKNIKLHEQTENSLTFALSYDNESLKNYPFKFAFYITYLLVDNKIEVIHRIKNCDDKTMYFSVGGHPAFKCPVFKNEEYDDYYLEFEHSEKAETHLVNIGNGLISSKTEAVFNNSNTIKLTHDLFNRDALVFKDLKSKKVTLKSKLNGDILSVSYNDFSYLGIWAKPEGDYVCIEPWLGVADSETTNQNFKTKEGIITLQPKNTFEASYTIEIHNNHLV
ncbi:aldose 1-epimerase family protein [Wocania ichthyoenteri]|uniref:aldose 1-epimerase family protein n=1 Tax=Wocania ichthyoenteri TaxID=1230531 RepID=UPI00053D60D4|nr:aldose 1-epimerase family protein [Wocania ichthyoenteri]